MIQASADAASYQLHCVSLADRSDWSIVRASRFITLITLRRKAPAIFIYDHTNPRGGAPLGDTAESVWILFLPGATRQEAGFEGVGTVTVLVVTVPTDHEARKNKKLEGGKFLCVYVR